jgi:hypothetical protein
MQELVGSGGLLGGVERGVRHRLLMMQNTSIFGFTLFSL